MRRWHWLTEDAVIRAVALLDANDEERRAVTQIVRDAWTGDGWEDGPADVAAELLREVRDAAMEAAEGQGGGSR